MFRPLYALSSQAFYAGSLKARQWTLESSESRITLLCKLGPVSSLVVRPSIQLSSVVEGRQVSVTSTRTDHAERGRAYVIGILDHTPHLRGHARCVIQQRGRQ
jgi:hypothetical protein